MNCVLWQRAALLCIGFSMAGAAGAANTAQARVDDLAAAERAFAAEAQVVGVRGAFVKHLAADAWLLRPQPVRAKAWFDAHPGGPGTLRWGPEYAEIAASGDFGYTYGPWNSETPEGEKAAGHFFSVWKRGADGVWRNALDHGVSHGPVVLDASLTLRAPGAALPERLAIDALDAARTSLHAADDALNGDTAQAALAQCSSAEVRLFEEGKMPQVTSAPPAASVAPSGLRRVGSDLAASGDLAYTVGGRADARADAPGGYVRMWRRDAARGWLLVAALATAPDEPRKR
ncbi:hypothetical protein [Tahibacter soli]|uniref:DUF4440 domain-containing protein n=1 Tax=Tahibacter soli TaxID=2983605 RepID=A0A9X3YHR3_9GAMM|nr:hypothetical protein [Tahibacter soli]MDC8011315.1 hypothetical protein [Tahibacter soli]